MLKKNYLILLFLSTLFFIFRLIIDLKIPNLNFFSYAFLSGIDILRSGKIPLAGLTIPRNIPPFPIMLYLYTFFYGVGKNIGIKILDAFLYSLLLPAVYLFSKKFTKDDLTSFITAIVVMLLPQHLDFINTANPLLLSLPLYIYTLYLFLQIPTTPTKKISGRLIFLFTLLSLISSLSIFVAVSMYLYLFFSWIWLYRIEKKRFGKNIIRKNIVRKSIIRKKDNEKIGEKTNEGPDLKTIYRFETEIISYFFLLSFWKSLILYSHSDPNSPISMILNIFTLKNLFGTNLGTIVVHGNNITFFFEILFIAIYLLFAMTGLFLLFISNKNEDRRKLLLILSNLIVLLFALAGGIATFIPILLLLSPLFALSLEIFTIGHIEILNRFMPFVRLRKNLFKRSLLIGIGSLLIALLVFTSFFSIPSALRRAEINSPTSDEIDLFSHIGEDGEDGENGTVLAPPRYSYLLLFMKKKPIFLSTYFSPKMSMLDVINHETSIDTEKNTFLVENWKDTEDLLSIYNNPFETPVIEKLHKYNIIYILSSKEPLWGSSECFDTIYRTEREQNNRINYLYRVRC